MNPALPRLETATTALLVIDMQDRLLPAIHEGQKCADSTRKLVEAAGVLGIPLLLTEQYPAGLGPTCASIRQAAGEAPAVEKVRFTACVEAITQRLGELRRPNMIVAGVETHVCVQQSVLDLLRLGYHPYVCADATGSRRPLDHDVALERMRQAGAVVTTVESAVFELLGQAGTELFKQVLRIVK